MNKQKYTTVEDVLLDLGSGNTTTEKLQRIKYKAKHDGRDEYSKLIEASIIKWKKYLRLEKAKEIGILPEDILEEWELRERVGFRGE